MLLKVKVFPCAKKERVVKKTDDAFEIETKEKPERGQANKRVVELLSSYLSVPEQRIRLVKGAKERNKIFEIKED